MAKTRGPRPGDRRVRRGRPSRTQPEGGAAPRVSRVGDRVIRHPRFRLPRVLGIPALFSTSYGDVGSSIYYALGVVALFALGATPIVLGIAGIFFIFTALTYAEGAATLPEAGGSSSFARHAFGPHVSFVAAWSLMLSYVITISISSFTIPPYLGYFWAPLKESILVHTMVSMSLVGFLIVINIVGVRESSFVNMGAAALDVVTQLLLILTGFVLLFDPEIFLGRVVTYWPTMENLVIAIAMASLAYTGVETISQMADETKQPQVLVPQAHIIMMFTVLTLFAGLSVVTISAMPPTELATTWAQDPIAGIASHMPIAWLRAVLAPLVAVLAATILFIATNAGLLGISRLAFSLGVNRQLPSAISKVHRRFKTPYLAILIFGGIALILKLPALVRPTFLADLGALYTFGSLLTYALAHASLLGLRIRRPDLSRPFKLGLNLKIAGRELPATAILGLMATFSIWLVIISIQPFTRWVGFAWMGLGLLVYFGHRLWRRYQLRRRVVRRP
ncbi:MAG: APC family permease [Chloroflexi bacterium]|nr:APC family permease [Chloroflexota bacterium]